MIMMMIMTMMMMMKVCDLRPANVVAEINWQNEKLVPKRNGSETRSKCEKVGHCDDNNDEDVKIDDDDNDQVSKCKYEDVESIKTEKVPVKNCDPVTETKKECKRVPVPVTRVSTSIKIFFYTTQKYLRSGGGGCAVRGALRVGVLGGVAAQVRDPALPEQRLRQRRLGQWRLMQILLWSLNNIWPGLLHDGVPAADGVCRGGGPGDGARTRPRPGQLPAGDTCPEMPRGHVTLWT